MFREKAFLDGFHASYLERQNYRFSSLFSLPTSNNPYLEGAFKTCRAVGRGVSSIVDISSRLDRVIPDIGCLLWDVGGAAPNMFFGTCTEGSRQRNAQRWQGITHAYDSFIKADFPIKTERLTELAAGFFTPLAIGKLADGLSKTRYLTGPPLMRNLETGANRTNFAESLSNLEVRFAELWISIWTDKARTY